MSEKPNDNNIGKNSAKKSFPTDNKTAVCNESFDECCTTKPGKQSAASSEKQQKKKNFFSKESLDNEIKSIKESVEKEVQDLKNILSTTKDQLEQSNDFLKKERADFINYKNRMSKQLEQSAQIAKELFCEKFFTVIAEAIRARDVDGDKDSPNAKINAKMLNVFENIGLKTFTEVGDIFDPNLHEAINSEESNDVDKDIVSIVIDPGFKMGEKILKTAKVIVKTPKKE